MAITVDVASTAIVKTAVALGNNGTTSMTINASATVAIIFIEMSVQGGVNDNQISPTITLGSQTPTQVSGAISHSGTSSTAGFVDMYYLLSPPTGSQTLSITTAGSYAGATGNYIAIAVSYLGTLESVQFGTAQTSHLDSVSSLTITDSLATGDLFVGGAVNGSSLPGITTGSSDATGSGDTTTASHAGLRVAHNSGTGSVSLVFSTNSADKSGATGLKLIAQTPRDQVSRYLYRVQGFQ